MANRFPVPNRFPSGSGNRFPVPYYLSTGTGSGTGLGEFGSRAGTVRREV